MVFLIVYCIKTNEIRGDKMPNKDKTGPRGAGPRDGRGRGASKKVGSGAGKKTGGRKGSC